MRAPVRHVAVLAVAALLLGLFVMVRPAELHPVHKWNRALADVAVVLTLAIFLLGPLARMWQPASRALEWRRELGVWAFVAATVHVGYYAGEALDWDLARFVRDSAHHGPGGEPLGPFTWRGDAWAAANWVGILALAYGVMPLLTSNNLSQRLLKAAWKRLQHHGHLFFVLTLLHFFLFWRLVYVPQQTGPAPALFWAAAVAFVAAQTVGLWWTRAARA